MRFKKTKMWERLEYLQTDYLAVLEYRMGKTLEQHNVAIELCFIHCIIGHLCSVQRSSSVIIIVVHCACCNVFVCKGVSASASIQSNIMWADL